MKKAAKKKKTTKKKSSKTDKKEVQSKEKKTGRKTVAMIIIVIILVAFAIYIFMDKRDVAEAGDTVLVNYVGRTEGEVFDTNIELVAKEADLYNPEKQYDPIEVQIGSKGFIPGFEDALYGMSEGETKTITIPPEMAYGEYDPKRIASFNLSEVADDVEVGTVLTDGRGGMFQVIEVNETSAVVDLNHPLAGKTLEFEITLVKVKE